MDSYAPWLYQLSAGQLAASAIGLALWALFWDRARGRKRCPRCWYDMSGAPGLRCPECGHQGVAERTLTKTRRRWRYLPLAGILLLGADSVRRIPDPDLEGWTRFVPTTAMILVPPMSREEWIDARFHNSPPSGQLARAFFDRLKDRKVTVWQEQLWGARLAAWRGPYGDPIPNSTQRLIAEVIPARAFSSRLWKRHPATMFRSLGGCMGPPERGPEFCPRDDANYRCDEARNAEDLLMQLIVTDSWLVNGGTEGRITWLDDRFFVIHRPDVVDEMRGTIERISAEASGPDRVTDPRSLASDRAILAGLSSRLIRFNGQQLIASHVIARINQAMPDGQSIQAEPRFLKQLSSICMTIPQGESSARDVLNRMEAEILFTEEFGFASWQLADDCIWIGWNGDPKRRAAMCTLQVLDIADLIEAAERADRAAGNARSPWHEERERDLIDIIEQNITPDLWVDQGGSDQRIMVMFDRLMITGYRRVHIQIADLLAKVRKSGIVMRDGQAHLEFSCR